MNIMAVR